MASGPCSRTILAVVTLIPPERKMRCCAGSMTDPLSPTHAMLSYEMWESSLNLRAWVPWVYFPPTPWTSRKSGWLSMCRYPSLGDPPRSDIPLENPANPG